MAAPGGTGPIGPFPDGVDEEEYDKLRRRLLWTWPSGLFVIGARAGDRRNLMTANWVMQLSFDPKLVAVSIEKGAVTHELIEQGGSYTVNAIDREDRAIVRKFTKPVEVDVTRMTMNEFPFRDGPVTGAPVLTQAASFIEGAVRNPVDVGGHTLFIAEIVNVAFQKAEDTPILRMEDTRMNYGG